MIELLLGVVAALAFYAGRRYRGDVAAGVPRFSQPLDGFAPSSGEAPDA